MLVAEPVPVSAHQRHHHYCLDLLRVTFDRASLAAAEDAVLLEVWDTGGLLQILHDVQSGVSFRIACGNRSVPATATCSGKDDYGYLVEFAVDPDKGWFPATYQPPYLLPGRS